MSFHFLETRIGCDVSCLDKSLYCHASHHRNNRFFVYADSNKFDGR